ncbi:MAG: butyrate kinase [Oscillospiraceae bacterium]|jgi:butyrate kinase
MAKRRIFVINCGSTSIKVAVFEEQECVLKENVHIPTEITAGSTRVVDQLAPRTEIIESFLADNKIDLGSFSIIASRGGPIPMCPGGAYAVNQYMIDVLTYAPRIQHASALSALIGDKLARKYNLPHIIYDSVSSDEMDELARYSGYPGIYFNSGTHILNARMVARRIAEKINKPFEECRFIIAHLGGGCSFNVVRDGLIVDYINDYRGTITPERPGNLPNDGLIDLCFSGKYTRDELQKIMMGGGGFISYIGTSDALKVEKMADAGDEKSIFLYELMSYNVAKLIGSLVPVLCGKVDRLIFTGGLARSKRLLDPVIERVSYIAPVEIIPGELEMEALALGALRVLDGKEPAKEFDVAPAGFSSKEEFYRSISKSDL